MKTRLVFVIVLWTVLMPVGVRPIRAYVPVVAVISEGATSTPIIAWRKLMGLPTDSERLAEASRDASGVEEFGVPLTIGETAELMARIARQPEVAAYRQKLEKDRDGFGGLWIDQTAGGVVDVAVVAGSGLERRAVDSAPSGINLRTRQVEYSASGLGRTHSSLLEIIESGQLGDYDILRFGVDIVANRVVVGVGTQAEDLERLLQTRLGKSVVVETQEPILEGACISRSNCSNPLRAGLAITSVVGGVTYFCTSGFVAHLQNSSNSVLLTAGHCGNHSAIGQTWRHNGSSIGTTQGSAFYNGSAADAQYIDISDTQESNYRYITNAVTSSATHSAMQVGDIVYKSGITTGVTSGPVEHTSECIYLDGVLFCGQVRAQVSFDYGDSGAPVYSGLKALGIGSAFDATGNFWLSHIGDTQNQMYLVVCTNLTCG